MSRREQRLQKILAHLRERSGPIPSLNLAELIGVTDRTIRSDVATLRARGFRINARPARGGGLSLDEVPFGTDSSSAQKSMANEPSLIGREREMAELAGSLESALAGHGQLVMIDGDPGIGKTRIAEALASLAKQSGAEVIWGRCLEARGAPPYWPWVQIIRDFVSSHDADTLRIFLGSGAAIIADIVPEIRHKLPDLDIPPVVDSPNAERFRFFDAITTLLKRAAQAAPLVLVLDDLQWADESPLRLLEFLSGELSDAPIMIVGTYRRIDVSRSHPLFAALGYLTRQRPFRRITLGGLEEAQVGKMIAGEGKFTPSAKFVSKIYSQTEGNPLFVVEMIRLVAEEGLLNKGTRFELGEWPMRLPEGVREAIGRRLTRLTDEAYQVLILAAFIGRQFRLRQLLAVEPRYSGNELLNVLEGPLEAQIVEGVHAEVGVFQFSHALVQETLVAELSAAQKVRLHARIAEALESSYGEQAGDHAAELANHFTEAEPIHGVEKAVKYLVKAGEHALDTNGYSDAEPYFRQAQTLRQGLPADEQTARIFHGLGRILTMEPSPEIRQEGWDSLALAFDIYVSAGNISAAVGAAETPVMFSDIYGTAALTSKALKLLDPDSLEAGYLMARHGIALRTETGDFESEIQAYDRAMKIATRFDDKQLEGRVNLHYGQHYDALGQPLKVIEYCQLAEELARGTGDQRTEFRAVNLAATIRIGQWDVVKGRSLKARATEIAVDIHHTIGIREAAQSDWEHALWSGDWERANEIVRNSFAGEDSEDLSYSRLIELHAYTGTQFADKDLGGHLANISKVSPTRRLALATAVLTVTGDASVVEHLDISMESVRSPIHADERRLNLMANGVRALAVNDDDSFPALYDELSRFSGWWNTSTGTAVDHILGVLASRLGEYDEAANHFERVIGRSRDAGFRPTTALVSAAYAEMLVERNSAGDQDTAAKMRADATSIATELGMQWLVDRIILQNELLALRTSTAKPDYPAGLTLREVEVVSLMAQGKTTNEIAEELVISRHTVARHTTNLYTKINARNRAEATAFALSELVPLIQDDPDK